jgi:hypothetical protein
LAECEDEGMAREEAVKSIIKEAPQIQRIPGPQRSCAFETRGARQATDMGSSRV